MRYSILINDHPRFPLVRLVGPEGPRANKIISCAVRDPMIVLAKVEDQFRPR